MVVKTCLLISDDPDDHVELSEALNEISNDTVVMTVSDVKKAIDLLVQKKCLPEFVLVNLGMADFISDDFFDALDDDPLLQRVQVIGFGDAVEANKVTQPRIDRFLNNDLSYSELKRELQDIIRNR